MKTLNTNDLLDKYLSRLNYEFKIIEQRRVALESLIRKIKEHYVFNSDDEFLDFRDVLDDSLGFRSANEDK